MPLNYDQNTLLENKHEPANELLVHWTYSRQEWNTFQRWTKRKKSFFHFLAHWITPSIKQTPDIRLTPETVSIGNIHQKFSGGSHEFKKATIRDEGKLNILEITYGRSEDKKSPVAEIRVPVPKGKLREAISVLDSLNREKI